MAKTIILNEMGQASTEQLKKNLENMQEERSEYVKHLDHHKRLITLNESRLVLTKKMSAISDVKSHMKEPQYAFQEDAEWLKLQSEYLQLESGARQYELEKEIERLKNLVEKTQDELDRFDVAIPKVVEEIAKRGA
jgi:hypothetical protein